MSAQLSLDQFASDDADANLDVLADVQRKDYQAVVIDDVRPTDQADRRGVARATVSRNVSRATEILEGRE